MKFLFFYFFILTEILFLLSKFLFLILLYYGTTTWATLIKFLVGDVSSIFEKLYENEKKKWEMKKRDHFLFYQQSLSHLYHLINHTVSFLIFSHQWRVFLFQFHFWWFHIDYIYKPPTFIFLKQMRTEMVEEMVDCEIVSKTKMRC